MELLTLAPGSDRIPVELFQILKDDAVESATLNMQYAICNMHYACSQQIGSFIFLELSCRSCLYIFEISCLSVASFAIIFSHSEGYLFTLLIVSFVKNMECFTNLHVILAQGPC